MLKLYEIYYQTIVFVKILPDLSVDREELINFRSHLDRGIFCRILEHCDSGHFSTIRLISNFTVDVSLDEITLDEIVLIKCWQSSRFALSAVYTL